MRKRKHSTFQRLSREPRNKTNFERESSLVKEKSMAGFEVNDDLNTEENERITDNIMLAILKSW